MGAAETITINNHLTPVNVLAYRSLFAVPEDDTRSEARKKIITYLKEFGVSNIFPVGHERFVNPQEVAEATQELFKSSVVTVREKFEGKGRKSRNFLDRY